VTATVVGRADLARALLAFPGHETEVASLLNFRPAPGVADPAPALSDRERETPPPLAPPPGTVIDTTPVRAIPFWRAASFDVRAPFWRPGVT
jgi:hypothetical protein